MSEARLLIVQHDDTCPPGWFGEWFRAAGLEYDVVHANRGEPQPDSLGAYAGLVVMGGAMGANDDSTCPWLTQTKRLIATTVADDGWFLGICLGHQLAAVALGGEVRRNPRGRATGLTPVRRTADGHTDLLLSATDDVVLAVQWNNDIVTRLPEGAVALATAPDGTMQATRYAEHAWGVQFHPEVSPDIFDTWTDKPSAPDPAVLDAKAIAPLIRAAEPELRAAWRPVADRFAGLVTNPAPVP